MTREEAIEKLRLFDFIGSNEDEEFLTALDMAIETLEQEPCDDCISRLEGMTNGEVMDTVFPKAKVDRYIDEYERPSDYFISIDDETYFTKEWWNAPYNGGAE